MPPSASTNWTNETLMRFLISCLEHTSSRPDFDKVGAEFGITSQAAYQKLWKLKKNKKTSSGERAETTPPKTPRGRKKAGAAPITPKSSSKKSKSSEEEDTRAMDEVTKYGLKVEREETPTPMRAAKRKRAAVEPTEKEADGGLNEFWKAANNPAADVGKENEVYV